MSKRNIRIESDNGLTSIIIAVHNHLEETQRCIRSIYEFTAKPYEIIIVDNASSDGTASWLVTLPEIKVIKNRENEGFSKAINRGISLATGEEILIIHNDVIVTPKWLDYMREALYSSDEIGAVGPISYGAEPIQQPDAIEEYKTIEQLNKFAVSIAKKAKLRWQQTMVLGSFCLLLKREVIDSVGELDEQFSPYYHEKSDYAFRMLKKGYRLTVSRKAFVHHTGRVTSDELDEKKGDIYKANLLKFKTKWGFSPEYSAGIRYDLLTMLDLEKSDLSILDIGCACGGNFIFIKEKNPKANLYGVELNPYAAEIASCFANVSNYNIEKNETLFWTTKFDYIIMGDVLEHLHEPLQTLKNLKRFLKPKGCLVVSIPNVMHISVLSDLLQGKWTYQDAGILDRTHLRFFTRHEIEKMFLDIDLPIIKMAYNSVDVTPEQDNLKESLLNLPGVIKDYEQFDAYQWVVIAQNKENGESRNRFVSAIKDLLNSDTEKLTQFIEHAKKENISFEQMYSWVNDEFAEIKVKVIVDFSVFLYKYGLKEVALKLIGKAYEDNRSDADITYANAFLLFVHGDLENAEIVIKNTVDKSAELNELLIEIKNSKP